VILGMQVVLRKTLNKRDKPLLDLQKALASLRLAQIIMVKSPVLGDFAVQFPTLLVRFLFEDAAVIFA
jgi:hypothetical protein